MRSLNDLLRRSRTDESTPYVYRWLFSRAQYLFRDRTQWKRQSFFRIFRSLINQYHRHVPIEYLCGSAIFFHRLFIVNRHVLIPRRDSETLIHHVQELYAQKTTSQQSVIEIGTGSGCLSITLARLFPRWQIHACDISASALRVARNNAYLHRCSRIQFHRGDLFDRHFLECSSFDMIISNPPYIPKEELPQCDRGILHEPAIALFVDPPLKFYSSIIDRAIQGWLEDDGYLIFECSPFNISQIKDLFLEHQHHFEDIQIRSDTNDIVRVISAKKKSAQS